MHTRNLPRDENPARRLRAFALGFVVPLCAWAITAQAQTSGQYIPASQPIPTAVRWVNSTATGAGVRGSFSYGGQQLTRSFGVSAGTLGTLAKGFIKRASAAAVIYQTFKSLIDGAGWVIDELQKQVTTPGTPGEPLQAGPVACSSLASAPSRLYCANTPSAVAAWLEGKSEGTYRYGGCVPNANLSGITCPQSYNIPNQFYFTAGRPLSFPDSSTPGLVNATAVEPVPITEQQLADLIKTHPDVVNAVMIDPDTGAPIRFPELVAALNSLRKEIEAANGLAPAPDLTVNPNYSTTPVEVQTPQPMELPAFCTWASTVCDWINWTKEVPDPEEPVEVPEEELDLDTPMGWTSGLGEGSCPAPLSTAIVVGPINTTVDYTFQPLCDLASLLRPLLWASAAIVAACIIGGSRRA